MKDNKNKELIEVIKQQLKNRADYPYKAGAWESFKEKYEATPKRKAIIPLWIGAAASVVVLAFGALFVLRNNESATTGQLAHAPVEMKDTSDKEISNTPGLNSEYLNKDATWVESDKGALSADNKTDLGLSRDLQINPTVRLTDGDHVTPLINRVNLHAASSSAINLNLQTEKVVNNPTARKELPMALFPDRDLDNQLTTDNNFISGEQIDESYAYTAEAGRNISPKKVRLAKNLKLGAYVSPSTTEESFDLGGGMVLAYQLSDKIAVRTGASFNQYEVGILGSSARSEKGMHDSPTTAGGAALVSENVAYRTNNVMIPNLNSVSGKMQTLDVPLEIKYNVTKDYYIVGGASYAFVLSQERYNYYSEYTDAITYSSASNSDKPTSTPQKTVERKIKSDTDNVDSDGFGGFVNFSIGKKTGLTKSLNISVEPFVKIPVGSFKQTDMNYTNGGIRIITNF